jgi:hypothetical protein
LVRLPTAPAPPVRSLYRTVYHCFEHCSSSGSAYTFPASSERSQWKACWVAPAAPKQQLRSSARVPQREPAGATLNTPLVYACRDEVHPPITMALCCTLNLSKSVYKKLWIRWKPCFCANFGNYRSRPWAAHLMARDGGGAFLHC